MTFLREHAHFGDYWPPDFGWPEGSEYDPEHNSQVLVPFSFDGVSFGSMNQWAVPVFTAFLSELVPHIKDGLHEGSCGCYNPRSISGGGTRSFHSWGIAIDINWDSNPMAALNVKDPGDLPMELTHDLARKYGLEWGGDWSDPKDWMHVEVHVSPGTLVAAQQPDNPDWSLMATEAQVRAIAREEALDAGRAIMLGGDHGYFSQERTPQIARTPGVHDRLKKLEGKK